MATSGIYFILNSHNGKMYVGSAVDFEKRWKNHRIELELNRHCNVYLQSAWNKYGADAFEFVIVENVADLDKLIEIEQLWIDASECCNREKGYNLCAVAGSAFGRKASEETKAKLSLAKSGHIVSAETRVKISAFHKGRKRSEETKLKLSLSHMGHKHSEEHKAKMSERMKGNQFNTGRKQSKEQIAKRVAKLTGKKRTDEQRLKITNSMKGRIVSAETKIKQSLAARARRQRERMEKFQNLD